VSRGKTAPADGQLSFGPAEVANSSQQEVVRTICTQQPEVLSAQLLNDALEAAHITSYEVGQLVGVSESLVNRWRSPNHRECPSFVQLLKLPPSFHFQLHRAMNRHYGFGRQLLARVLDDLGAVAVAVGE
jgi:hypothetical protein